MEPQKTQSVLRKQRAPRGCRCNEKVLYRLARLVLSTCRLPPLTPTTINTNQNTTKPNKLTLFFAKLLYSSVRLLCFDLLCFDLLLFRACTASIPKKQALRDGYTFL